MGFETPEEGYLAKILVPAGSKNVPIGKLVCIIVANEGSVTAFKDFKDDESIVAAPLSAPAPSLPHTAVPNPSHPTATSASTSAPSLAASASASFGNRIFVSPLAKRLASEKGLNLQVSLVRTVRFMKAYLDFTKCLYNVYGFTVINSILRP